MGLPTDGEQIQEAFAHGQVRYIGAPVLVGSLHPPKAQQIGAGLVPLRGPTDVELLIDRRQAHEALQPPDAFLVHSMAHVLQVPGHLPGAVARCFQELLVGQ